MTCPCERYAERAAIMQHDGQMLQKSAELKARLDTCVGCAERMGVDMFERAYIESEIRKGQK